MQQHPHFDLWLHDDAELANVLGSPLRERTTIHEWPLSCVQRIRTIHGAGAPLTPVFSSSLPIRQSSWVRRRRAVFSGRSGQKRPARWAQAWGA
jgi:hypothetical protein